MDLKCKALHGMSITPPRNINQYYLFETRYQRCNCIRILLQLFSGNEVVNTCFAS